MTSIDLTSLRSLPTDDLCVRHPVTGEPTGWVITFAGPSHPKTLSLRDEALRKRLKADRERDLARIGGRSVKEDDRSIDEIQKQSLRFVVGRIISWAPDVAINGTEYSFSPDAAMELLGATNMSWLLNQCESFLVAADSFFIKPENSS